MTDRHAENRRILEYFEKSPDRARSSRLNPLFSGRAEVMDKLVGSVEELLAEPEPLEGMTHVVHGAPGAGKSECMFQFMDRLRRLDRPDLIVAQAGVEALFSARELWGAIQPAVMSMRRVATGSLRDRLERLIDEIESFAVLGVSFRKTRRNEAGPSILQTDLLREMAEKLAALPGNPTVVLCIDEIQSMQAPGGKDWTGFASRFELGRASLKIMPVYFGLGNSPDVLGDHGLSRLAEPNVFPLRGIDEEAVGAIARRFLEAFEDKAPRTSDRERWISGIVEQTSGWPQHVSSFLRTVRALQQGDRPLDDGMFEEAMRKSHERKQSYYGARISACKLLEDEQVMLARAFEEDSDHIGAGAVGKALDIKDKDALLRFLDDAVRAGVLHKENERYSIAIPSMKQRLALGDEVPFAAPSPSVRRASPGATDGR